MTANSEVSNALNEAFGAAFLLTGSSEAAENAVLDGIAASEFGAIVDHVLILEAAKSAIQRRADFPDRSEQALSHLPLELQRPFLLDPISRDAFVLRVLLGIPPATCSAVLHLSMQEVKEGLSAAFKELPFLEARSA
jgi:DNA-directed RNA polymerase specialized sigma24 family protein